MLYSIVSQFFPQVVSSLIISYDGSTIKILFSSGSLGIKITTGKGDIEVFVDEICKSSVMKLSSTASDRICYP